MTPEEFETLMDSDYDSKYIDDDNAFVGLQIIRKYLPKSGIEGADHDVIYSASVEKLLEAGITKEDAIELRRLNWMIEDGEYLACFV